MRPGLTLAIGPPAPRAANRDRRSVPEPLPGPVKVGATATGRQQNQRRACAIAGTNVGCAHHPQAHVVVAVVRVDIVAVGRASIVLIVVPRPAAHRTPPRRGEPRWPRPAPPTLPRKGEVFSKNRRGAPRPLLPLLRGNQQPAIQAMGEAHTTRRPTEWLRPYGWIMRRPQTCPIVVPRPAAHRKVCLSCQVQVAGIRILVETQFPHIAAHVEGPHRGGTLRVHSRPPSSVAARFRRCLPVGNPRPRPKGIRSLGSPRWPPAATPPRWAAGPRSPAWPSTSGRRRRPPTTTRFPPGGCHRR